MRRRFGGCARLRSRSRLTARLPGVSIAYERYLARRASDKKRGRDGTKYSKFHPRGYLSHHLAATSMAAVYTDAAHIADGVIGLKQRSLAASDPTE